MPIVHPPIEHSHSRGRRLGRALQRIALGALLGAASAASAHAATAYALTTANELLVFDTATPGTVTTVAITGVQTGEAILAIDVRPATGQLYALGSGGRLYVIDPATGVARQVGTAAFSTPLSGSAFGFDFNPTVDRIRVVSDGEQNLRLNPDTGAVAAADTNLGTTGDVVASAYTNNFSGAAATTLYGIDAAGDQLVLQGGVNGAPSPNGGAITAVGPLGVDTSTEAGFDITANEGAAFASLTVAGVSRLYRINLASGAATLVGTIGTGAPVRGLAILSRAATLYGVTTTNQLVRFHSASPGTIISARPITGLQTSENILGLDFRPANGELYALGSSSRLYRVDTATAVATVVGAGAFTPALQGTAFGFDFNPVVDRIRIVSDASQNFRLNPDTGALAGADTSLTNNGSPETAVGVAYTNNIDGATQTTLYTLDAADDRLGLQGSIGGAPTSPNAGIVTDVGPLGVDTTDAAGFDISSDDGSAFAALTVSGVPSLYAIDLSTGAATLLGAIGAATPLRALAAQPTTYNLAEGSTGAFFDTDLLVLNPNPAATPATVTYLRQDGVTVTQGLQLGAMSRTTITVDATPGVEASAFSSVVGSPLGLPLVVERTMRWDPTGYGSHTEKASPALARQWYFAEGSQGFFDTFLLLANPSATVINANVEFLVEGGGAPIVRNYPVPARSRLTVYTGAIAELVNTSFGITVTFDRAAAAERAMYFGTPTFNAGHESSGVTSPSTSWFLAEGATGTFFTTFLLLANPGDTPANVTLNYFREAGGLVTRTKTLPARSRLSVNVATEDSSLAATAVATQVLSDVPIVAERAQYWPFDPAQWREAHNSFGVKATALRWGLAEGRVGGAAQYQTYILLANPGATAADVTIAFMRTTGTPITKNFTVPANGRFTVTTGPGSLVPELADEHFGALVTATQPVFVERALYSNDTAGVFWAAGTNATATPVP